MSNIRGLIMDDGIQPHFNTGNCRIRISDLLFTDTNILKALSNLSAKTSCGEDGLPSMFFKKCSQAVVQPLKLIFQRSLETSELPCSRSVDKSRCCTYLQKR